MQIFAATESRPAPGPLIACNIQARMQPFYRQPHLFHGLNEQPLSTSKGAFMIRKLKSGEYRLYSRKKDDSTGKRRNLGTFSTMEKAKQHEREVQYFKRH
jgi:hypothetical protein